MPYEADILRGVRVAVVTFALILCGIIGYRISSDAAPEPEAAKPVSKGIPPNTVVKEPIENLAAASAVPAPPPVHRIVKKRIIAPPPAQTAIAAAVPTNQARIAVAAESKAATVQSPIEEIALPAPLPVTAQPAVASVVSQPVGDVAAPGRAKRWIKAVGRVFRIGGKKEVAPEALRVPESGQSAESAKADESVHP